MAFIPSNINNKEDRNQEKLSSLLHAINLAEDRQKNLNKLIEESVKLYESNKKRNQILNDSFDEKAAQIKELNITLKELHDLADDKKEEIEQKNNQIELIASQASEKQKEIESLKDKEENLLESILEGQEKLKSQEIIKKGLIDDKKKIEQLINTRNEELKTFELWHEDA